MNGDGAREKLTPGKTLGVQCDSVGQRVTARPIAMMMQAPMKPAIR